MRLFDDVASRVEDPFLSRALGLALRGVGRTWPNPAVGCVIVSDGSVVGEGSHPRAGEPHAEVLALAQAGAKARGATVYVTLEPCSHHGRTPPCAEALIEAGVSRVVVGMPDPNPDAAGGAAALRAAGIEVSVADDPSPFAAVNEGWLQRVRTGRPRVTVKAALSLDGHGAFSEGERAAITGASGALVTRTLRDRADAVMVGCATLQADDPSLTVRDAQGRLEQHQPLRVVLCRTASIPSDARVLTDEAGPVLALVSAASLATAPRDGRLLVVQAYDADRGLAGALEALGERGVGSLLVEAGPRLLTALYEQALIDELVVVAAGGMAGREAPPLFLGAADREGSALSHRLLPVEAGIVGDVAVTTWESSRTSARSRL